MVTGGNPVHEYHCKIREALPSEGPIPPTAEMDTQYDEEGSALLWVRNFALRRIILRVSLLPIAKI